MNTELIRLKAISNAIGLSTATLRRMIKRNELSGVLLGGNYYVTRKDYDELLFNIECKKLNVTPRTLKLIEAGNYDAPKRIYESVMNWLIED